MVANTSSRGASKAQWRLAAVVLATAFFAAVAALAPTWHKGIGPRPALENLIAARSWATGGAMAVEDGRGVFLSSAEGQRTTAEQSTDIGNRLTIGVLARCMAILPALTRQPEWLSALMAAMAAALVALAGARLEASRAAGGRPALAAALAGGAFVTLPVAWIAAASPAHLDLASLATALGWFLLLGSPRRPSMRVMILAGLAAGVAAAARDAYVTLAGMGVLVLLGRYPASSGGTPTLRRRLLQGGGFALLAATVFLVAGGADNVYWQPEQSQPEFNRLGHAFPDFYTFERYQALSPAERAADAQLAKLDPRLASMYAGHGDPSPGGLLGRLMVRSPESMVFYARELLAFDAFGGFLPLALIALGVLAAKRRGQPSPMARALIGGFCFFFLFHCWIGTSNESHFAVFAAPVALAIAAGLMAAAAAIARWLEERPRELVVLAVLAACVFGHQVAATRVAMSRLYNGAGMARYGTEDAVKLARRVAAATTSPSWPPDARVLVGTRGEDALAIAFLADRSALVLAPESLAHLADAGELESYLRAARVGLVVEYDRAVLEQPDVAAALAACGIRSVRRP